MADKLSDQAIATRVRAKGARRLALTPAATGDVDRLLRYAEELEAEPAELERRAKDGCCPPDCPSSE